MRMLMEMTGVLMPSGNVSRCFSNGFGDPRSGHSPHTCPPLSPDHVGLRPATVPPSDSKNAETFAAMTQ